MDFRGVFWPVVENITSEVARYLTWDKGLLDPGHSYIYCSTTLCSPEH